MPIPFVSETIIEEVATKLGNSSEDFSNTLWEMNTQQPYLFSYLFSENFKLLTQEEKDYILYLALVIWQSIQAVQATPHAIEPEVIDKMEEANWELWEQPSTYQFQERMDAFFETTPQEDLLAFVEDALVDDNEEEQLVTKEGRGLIVIGLKTIIDCFCK